MSIRWRLGALAIQLAVLLLATHLATGTPWSDEIWFLSGLLAIALNRQLQEPFFTRPVDTLAHSIVGLILVAVADKSTARPGWWAAAAIFTAAGLLSLSAQLFGRTETRAGSWGRGARRVTAQATAMSIYSVLFFLALIEAFDVRTESFWQLAIAWAIVALIGSVDWEHAWTAARGAIPPAEIQGFVGPSRILLTRTGLPPTGSSVRLRKGSVEVEGVVVRRIRRINDVYGEIFVPPQLDPERFVRGAIEVNSSDKESETIGVVDHGSTDRVLRFIATRELAVGDAVFGSARTRRTDLPDHGRRDSPQRRARRC